MLRGTTRVHPLRMRFSDTANAISYPNNGGKPAAYYSRAMPEGDGLFRHRACGLQHAFWKGVSAKTGQSLSAKRPLSVGRVFSLLIFLNALNL
ncbi:MAG: hypothetical protein GX303_05900 [Clostridiales bacterium]|nr:hypothetical protein [Clostridiales bacterium]